MNNLRRAAPLATRPLRSVPSQYQRRAAHDAPSHAAPVKESFGAGFYIVLGLLPASFALYKIAAPDDGGEPVLTKWIETYSNRKQEWTERNDLHTKLVQRAADDRNLFFSSIAPRHVELRFPEAFNTGSPFNVSAGSVANVDKVIAHYEKKNHAAQAKKLEALQGQEQNRKL